MKWLAPVAIVVLAVLAELTLGRATSAPDFALFVGRFHPLVVHLPIGFILLLAMAEAATLHPRLRGRVEPMLGLLVPVSALAALAAFLMGQLLALEGGFPAGALGWHRRLTLLAVMGMAACWLLYDRQSARSGEGGSRWIYRGVLGVTLGLLSLGAHFGGTMTRGESYLSKYAPRPLKPLLGAPEPEKPSAKPPAAAAPGAEPLVYRDVVQPLLTKYCVDCHGSEKQKGKLRLDSLELVMKGGEDGPVVVPGAAAKSLLVTRMLLPVADDDHMPPKDEPAPPPDAIALLQFWIERGASPTLKVRDALPPSSARSLLEHALGASPSSSAVPVSVPATPGAAANPDAAAPSNAPANAAGPDSAAHPDSAANTKSVRDAPPASTAEATTPASRDTTSASTDNSTSTSAATTPATTGAVATSGPAVLSVYCEKCHGASKQKGKLRVDSVDALVKGGASGAALVPGSPDRSSIVQRLRLPLTDDDHMPPAKERQPSASELAALASWVRSGAHSGGIASVPSTSPKAPPSTAANPLTPGSVAAADHATSSSVGTGSAAASGSPASSSSATATPAATSSAPPPPADVSGPPAGELLASLPPKVALFTDAIKPLFREKCGKCHIKQSPAGGLGVEQTAQLREGGFSGAGVVPKDRKTSVVMQRIVLPADDGDHMPPDGEPALSVDEIELVGAWIDQGAPATEPTPTARLTAGAARALSARGIMAGAQPQPQPLAAQAGGCAACSLPGAPQPKWLGLQALALLATTGALALRRQRRTYRQAHPAA